MTKTQKRFEILFPGLSQGMGSVDRRLGLVLDPQERNSRASGSTLPPTARSNSCTYNNSCPPFRDPCMADFLMEFRRGHCTDAPFPLHREKMVMGMDMDMDVGIAMVMGEVGSQFEKRPKTVLKKVLKKSAKKSSHSESTKKKCSKKYSKKYSKK